MGIEIGAEAAVPRRGLLRRMPGRDRILRDIRDAIEAAMPDPLLRRAARFTTFQHTLAARVYPAGGVLEFTWEPDGRIVAETKTSVVGPGFHALVVDLLDAVRDRLGLEWQWADESDYALTRDYGALQREMAVWLRALAKAMLGLHSHGYSALALNWSLRDPAVSDGSFAVSPAGPWTQAWLASLEGATGEEVAGRCEEFFPWWHRPLDARFWQRLGLTLLWSAVQWHVPATQEEAELAQFALDCFGRARELDEQVVLPRQELGELEALLDRERAGMGQPPPRPDGIGFRRRLMSHRATGQWTIRLPGYYYESEEEEEEEEDAEEAVFWFGDRTVRVSSITVRRKDGSPPPPRELLPERSPDDVDGARVMDVEEGHLKGWASIRQAEEEGERFWMLQGHMACEGNLCICTICYADAADEPWAIDTYQSLMHPEPGADEQTDDLPS